MGSVRAGKVLGYGGCFVKFLINNDYYSKLKTITLFTPFTLN